jgi:cellulose synthase/poly-beta-1,6-N-acetylglucosamine synthase-like glycosyltransferase
MVLFFDLILIAATALIAVPATLFLVEVLASARSRNEERMRDLGPQTRLRIGVLVPAHDESMSVLPTISDIKEQLLEGDRIVVIADNCTDDTASVARSAGAEVVERDDPTLRGKGFALDFGLKHLQADPPDVVVMVDADCRVVEGSVTRLAEACVRTGRPVQALDLMTARPDSSINYRVAEFAWRVKNWVRPLGLARLGLPCQLMGTGMAFPWSVIRAADLASGAIVEDVKLGLELAQSGTAPLFCPSARVTSHFPVSRAGAVSQRRRWESGHIKLIADKVPSLLFDAIRQRNRALLVLAVDLAVPPLSLFVLLLGGALVASSLALLAGYTSVALALSGWSLGAFTVAIIVCWWTHGRDLLPIRAIGFVILYVVRKLPIYRGILSKRLASEWKRAERQADD